MKLLGLRIERDKTVRKATLAEIQQARNIGGTFWDENAAWAPSNYGNYYAQSVPAYRAVKLRGDAVASAPLRVYKRNANGEQEKVGSEHPVQQLLDKVNAWWTHADLLRATEIYLCLWGSAYWFVEKQGNTPVALWPLRPDRIRVVPGTGEGPGAYIAGFLYQGQRGNRIALTLEELVWFRYFNPLDEYAGLSPVSPAALTLNMGRNALRFNASFFENGAIPQDVIYPVQGPITDEEIEEFYRRLEKRHKGATKAHRPLVVDLSQAGKPERLGLSQRDMEFLASLNFTNEDAARVWGVPPPKMYSQVQSTYNNVKQADIEFYADTVSAEWRFLEAEITEMLMPLFAEQGLSVAFDTSNVLPLQEALAELHERQRLDMQAGILTINEVRQSRHLEPVPWGDKFWGPLTLIPIGEGVEGEMAEMVLPSGNGHQPLLVQKQITAYDRAVDLFGKRLDRNERLFLRLQRGIFQQQRAEALKRLRSQRTVVKQEGDIFDPAEWTVRMKGPGKPILLRILVTAALEHAGDFGLGPFDGERLSVLEWVDTRLDFWADRVNMETAKLLMAEMEEGAKAGEGIPDLARRVEKVFNFNDAVRAERIARTETLAASNAGHLEVYAQAGVEEKMWLAAMDERTRPAHAEAHGQVVPRHSPFVVGGETLEAPGIGGSPENVINCRCTVSPVIRRRALPESNGKETALAIPRKTERKITRDNNGFIVKVEEEVNG